MTVADQTTRIVDLRLWRLRPYSRSRWWTVQETGGGRTFSTDLAEGREETPVRLTALGRGIDVFGLGQAGQLVLVAWEAAEEDGAADAEDGGAPAEAVGPGVVVVAIVDQLVELHGVDDEGDDLQDH